MRMNAASCYTPTEATKESITLSTLCTKPPDAHHKNPSFVFRTFSAPTLRGGLGANQSVGHLNSMGIIPEREFRLPLNNYLFLCLNVGTESGALRPAVRSIS